jgi:Fe-S cluster assembly protein SufB
MLDVKIVATISKNKNEPDWMLKFRLAALKIFLEKPDIVKIDFDKIAYHVDPVSPKARSWDSLPKNIRETYEKIGIPEAESKYLAGVEAQYDSDAIYGSFKKKLEAQGIIFTDTDSALKKYPEIFKKYFGKLVPATDNKFAALNSACWSGGSFIYVPKGVKVELPLQAYFRINAKEMGQFERTLIIADEGSSVKYIEGCSAPVYSVDSLHAAVVEVFVEKNATVTYTTIQNWSEDVINLVTKRAKVEAGGTMVWTDCNLGSKMTMKYPSCYLVGEGARGEMLSLAIAGKNQVQDTGAKMFHLAPKTTSQIISKSISLKGGKNVFRGTVEVNSSECKSKTKCESLILDADSSAQSFPAFKAKAADAQISHEATISKIEEDQLFYLQNRGVTKDEAESLIVNGFVQPIIKQLPMEYAVELNRLIELELEGHEAGLSHIKKATNLL